MSSNLTIRIDPKLKAQAEAACLDADLTLSQVVRAALRDFVKNSGVKTTPHLIPKKPASAPKSLPVFPARARYLELQDLERRNLLNKVTRAELKALRERIG